VKKELIITWKQSYDNVTFKNHDYFGLGDMLRGSLVLFRLAKDRGYNINVDTHLYPCMKFAKKCTSEYSEFIDKNSKLIGMIHRNIYPNESWFDEKTNWIEDKIFCMSNHGSTDDVCKNQEEKEFLKSIISPSEEVQKEVNNILSKLPKEYNAIHARFDDKKIIEEFKDYDLNMFDNIKEENDILFSNSNYFKQNCNITSVDLQISHTGYEKDQEKLKNTFIYFHLIANSKKIKSYTDYSWTSGFVWWCSQIYDIPLEIVKL
jgi:hypothetical protein